MRTAVLFVVAAAPVALPAAADIVSIVPDKDNTLYQYVPEEFEGPLSNGAGSHVFSGVNAFGRIRRALLRFDVAGAIPAGSVVTAATLRLNVSQSQSGEAPFTVHAVLADWGEGLAEAPGNGGAGATADAGSATWFARFYPGDPWSIPGGDFSSSASATLIAGFGGPCQVTAPGLASDIQGWLDNAAANFGWCIVGPEGSTRTAKRFDSSENPEEAVRPLLTVVFTPPVGCVGDYNQDGGVDGADVEAFYADWESGDAAADLNQDGGVDGADVESFFAAWENGC